MKLLLLELVWQASELAGSSGRALLWKIQRNTKGTLIQLVWKP